MKLLVGLGNPGSQYAGTRHNVGFEVVEAMATRLTWISRPDLFDTQARMKFDGLVMDGSVGSDKLMLLKPATFMNASGRAVQAAMAFYQLTPQDVLIVLDDLALPSGRIRLRPGGSSGGHNGLKDIEQALATDQYPRLRLGIDAAPERMAARDYVLGKFSTEQRKLLEPAIDRAVAASVMWIEKGIESAMSLFNADI
jgi:PTH1 family peptidyl-tRNA hydrolase